MSAINEIPLSPIELRLIDAALQRLFVSDKKLPAEAREIRDLIDKLDDFASLQGG